jgi:hypothetical protein
LQGRLTIVSTLPDSIFFVKESGLSAPPLDIAKLPTELGEALRHFERAQSSQASLSDIILGGQDGLVNVLSVILGVAAAGGRDGLAPATAYDFNVT